MTQTKTLKNKIYQKYEHRDKQKIWIVLYVKENSESRELHRSMHMNTWAVMKHTHTHTHTFGTYTSLRREGKGRARATKHFTEPEKPEPKCDVETTKGENHRKLFFPGFCFPEQNIHKQDSSINEMDNISCMCTYFFSGTCGWFHPKKSIQFKY